MDPLSIISASVGLASVIAKVSVSLTSFGRDARDAAKDLDAISAELRAISNVLGLLGQSLPPSSDKSPIPEALLRQIDVNLSGTTAIVEQIEENVQKYRRNRIFTKADWALFGQADTRKIRDSLEAYKLALSLGLNFISITLNQAVKEDTSAIHEYAVAIKMNTDDILARVNSIRRDPHANKYKRVEDWIEDMAVLSSYAESTHQATTTADFSERLGHFPEHPMLPQGPGGSYPDHSQQFVPVGPRRTNPMGFPPQHVDMSASEGVSAPSTPNVSTAYVPTTTSSAILSSDNLDSDKPTTALARNSDDINGTGKDMSNQLSLFGWRQQAPPPPLVPGTGESLQHVFRTSLQSFQHFQHSSKAQVPGDQPAPQAYHHCDISLFEWFPPSEASTAANTLSFVFFTVALSLNDSDTQPSRILFSIPKHSSFGGQRQGADKEVILTFFDAKSLQEFRGHLVGAFPRLEGSRHEFSLAGYNAVEYRGLGTSARIPQPIDKLLATTHTWPTVWLFEPSTSGNPHRLVVESQDGLTFINYRIGPQYHKFVSLGWFKADECLLVISQSLASGSRSNFLMFTCSPPSVKPASIHVKELQGMHAEKQAYCEYRFQNLGSLHRFQQAMTGYAVLFDGWLKGVMFGRRRDFAVFTIPGFISWGPSAKKCRVQILGDNDNGAVRIAVFSPPSRRHKEGSQTSFQLNKEKHYVHYMGRKTVVIKDESSTLPSETIDAWKGVSPNEGNFLDLGIGGGKTGKGNDLTFFCKNEADSTRLLSCLTSLGLPLRAY